MNAKRGCLIFFAAIILVGCVALAMLVARYQSLSDKAENITFRAPRRRS